MIEYVLAFVLPAAYALLPEEMRSAEASALLLAIGLQESGFRERRQIGGPARGWFQFELGGVRGVLKHPNTAAEIAAALKMLRYPAEETAVLAAIEHNDTLASVFARGLLWTLPGGLPGPNDPPAAWRLYLEGWRPGEPKAGTWQANYSIAWGAVLRGRSVPPTMNA